MPTFAGIPWGASRAQVLEAAAASGLRVVGHLRQRRRARRRAVRRGGQSCKALLSPTDGLVKVQVRFTANDTPARTYATVIERLTALYGPTEPVEMFKRPYVRGDGREDEAVLTGKGMLIAAWGDERQPGQAAVILHAGQPGRRARLRIARLEGRVGAAPAPGAGRAARARALGRARLSAAGLSVGP